MTVRRLALTAAAMTAIAGALRALTGAWQSLLATLADAPTSATAEPERVVLAVIGLLAWVAWAWGALGLALTAVAALPGAVGSLARDVSRLVLPAGLRTASGLALGVGLVVAAPAAAAAPADDPGTVTVPDWPAADGGPRTPVPPDWPAEASPSTEAEHVVEPGDCLWRIAEDRSSAAGLDPTDADVARAVDRWWSTNAPVIGPDPDLIHPGQVLRPPAVLATASDLPPGSTR
jgi:hypothetical protein